MDLRPLEATARPLGAHSAPLRPQFYTLCVLGGVRVVSKEPRLTTKALLSSGYSAYLRRIERADERTRTAFLLITSVRSAVAGSCMSLQIPHRKEDFCSLHCPLLQGI